MLVVARSDQQSSVFGALQGLVGPIAFGLAACLGFYVLILRGPLGTPLTMRYFAGHPVNYTESIMFFIGLAALLAKLMQVSTEMRVLPRISLGNVPEHGQRVEDCDSLLTELESLPTVVRKSYLAERLLGALEFVRRRGSADGLEDQLKYLADTDAARQDASYALPRIVIWATPMLGFLGTVIGITQALGNLDPQEIATSIETAMGKLTAGLYVAFDTTAQALCLSMLLMFIQFVIDRIESSLLATVDARADEELVGRFQSTGTGRDPYVISVERVGQAVVKATEMLVHRQIELWQATIDAAHSQWTQLTQSTTTQLEAGLTRALDHALQRHATAIAHAEEAADERIQDRWQQWQTALSDSARKLHDQQVEMVRHGQILHQVVQATGNVVKLEHALNDNLKQLAGSANFEQTVLSLAAAVNLLGARLGTTPVETARVELAPNRAQGRAA